MNHLWERVRTHGWAGHWILYICVHCGTKKRLKPGEGGTNPEKRAEYKQPGDKRYAPHRPRCYLLRNNVA